MPDRSPKEEKGDDEKMKTKIVSIFAVLLIALAVVGFAYAHWFEMLYINGTVNTGSLDATFSIGDCYDTEPLEKDVSSISCELDPADPTGHTLKVTVTNAYPCIDYYQEFDITNTGTIPLHVYSFKITESTLPVGSILEITDKAGEDFVCTQIHPKESAWGIIHIHLPQEAAELATYTFKATIEVVQWNYPF